MIKPLLLFMALLLIPLIAKVTSPLFIARHPETGDAVSAPLKHLGIIMDGNRRWAKKQHRATKEGHQKGAETVRRLIAYCLEHHIEMVSIYAFSLENFKRDPEEVQNILKIMIDEAEKTLPDLIKNGVKVRFLGDEKAFPETIRATIARVEKATQDCSRLQLNVLFCYGGRQEILSAVQHIIQDVKAGKIDDIKDEEAFKKYLWTSNLPDPDLVIRTGRFKRLSNFLGYQTSYSELYFTDRLWPDLTANDLDQAIQDYKNRKRNFGS